MSRHPGIARWTDYLRGLAAGAERDSLRQHLDSGCERCTKRVAALERCLAVARADARLTLPAAALRLVKALAALHRPDRRSWLDAASFALLRDTAVEGALAGIRSSEPAAGRSLLFEAEELKLDLSIEAAAAPAAGWSVTGSCFGVEGEPLAGAAVMALREDRIVDRTVTGELGEFQFAGLPAEALELWLIAGSGRPLVADLDLSS